MNMQPFVYGLVDPLEPGHVRYVGMAMRAARPYDHAKSARRESTKSSYQINWIRKLYGEGRDYEVIKLEELAEGVTRSFVGFVERCYIKSLRKIGHKLTNQHEGGFGGDPGQEARVKIGDAQRGTKHTQEHKDAIGAASKGHVTSDKTCVLISEAKKKYYSDPLKLEELSNIIKATYTPELRDSRRASNSARETAESTREKHRNAWTDERREAAAKRVRSPEEVARQREGLRIHFAKKKAEKQE